MKLNKLLLTMGLAAGLGLAAQAQAAAFFNGTSTLADWFAAGPVTDGDNDSTWTLISYDAALEGTLVSLSEIELGGTDFYTVAFDFAPLNGGDGLLAGTYNLVYSATQILPSDEFFVAASLDSTHVGTGTTVSKNVYDSSGGTLLAALASLEGDADEGVPLIPTSHTIYVEESFVVGTAGSLTSSENGFAVESVPEPATLALMGLGLLGLGFHTRRRAA